MVAAHKDTDPGESKTPNPENRPVTFSWYLYSDIQLILYYSISGQNIEMLLGKQLLPPPVSAQPPSLWLLLLHPRGYLIIREPKRLL